MPYVAAHVQGNVGTSDALYTAVVGVVSLWVLASSNGVAAAVPGRAQHIRASRIANSPNRMSCIRSDASGGNVRYMNTNHF
jgi:hypothetical protein